MKLARAFAILSAITTWAALLLQLVLIIRQLTAQGETVSFAIWRYFGFFTVLTNVLVALVATAMAMNWLRYPSAKLRLATVTAIALVGLVYSIALRNIWQPEGWQAVADHGLHDASPLLFLAAWWFSPHLHLNWKDVLWATLFPTIYCAYALLRGSFDGWYAYWFFNPDNMSFVQLLGVAALLLLVVLGVATVFVGIDRWLALHSTPPKQPLNI